MRKFLQRITIYVFSYQFSSRIFFSSVDAEETILTSFLHHRSDGLNESEVVEIQSMNKLQDCLQKGIKETKNNTW